jgi:hypothetical protein
LAVRVILLAHHLFKVIKVEIVPLVYLHQLLVVVDHQPLDHPIVRVKQVVMVAQEQPIQLADHQLLMLQAVKVAALQIMAQVSQVVQIQVMVALAITAIQLAVMAAQVL